MSLLQDMSPKGAESKKTQIWPKMAKNGWDKFFRPWDTASYIILSWSSTRKPPQKNILIYHTQLTHSAEWDQPPAWCFQTTKQHGVDQLGNWVMLWLTVWPQAPTPTLHLAGKYPAELLTVSSPHQSRQISPGPKWPKQHQSGVLIEQREADSWDVDMDCCTRFAKFLLCLFNFAFFVSFPALTRNVLFVKLIYRSSAV